jgi:cephalosporin hydroxylase
MDDSTDLTPGQSAIRYWSTPDSRPVALEESRLDFTKDPVSQMSFGERAAFEGILTQLRPELSIEIGTAEGGSLQRIAAYSKEVHSIDISHEYLLDSPGDHVRLHTGPSSEVLPQLLAEFASEGRGVDFALVDGDHSSEGAAGDLRTLLESPATGRCVILVHDMMNEEVRGGVESVGLDDYEKVVYYELDFVPGYVFRQGAARDDAWGGIALILCDTRRSAGYTSSVRQQRYYSPFDVIHGLRAELQDALARLAAAEQETGRLAHAHQVVLGSRSWRLTRPLRAVGERVRAWRAAT